MDPLLPGGLDVRADPAIFQVFPHHMGDIDHVIERERRLGIDIEEQEIGGRIRT